MPAHPRAEEDLEADDAGRGGRCPWSDAFLAYGGEHAPAVARQVSRTGCHTFRATGTTAHLSNGGTLEHAQRIAGHASPKTTKLYDRTADTISLDEIERIVI